MNGVERTLHQALENHPRCRRRIRDLYQRLLAVAPSRDRIRGALTVRPGFFYGFHTTCPWSPCNTLLLTHRCVAAPLAPPRPGQTVEVGIFSGPDFRTYSPLATTQGWNWQQGSMLQWLGTSTRLVFNDVVDGKASARIIDAGNQEHRELDWPVAAVSPCGHAAVSYSFDRFRRGMPGYEYAIARPGGIVDALPRDDGLFMLDLDTGTATLLFSLTDLAALAAERSTRGAYHFVSHCLFAPGGRRFAFFHRWLTSSGTLKTRMISCSLAGENIHVFRTGDFVSHFAWRDDDHLVAFCDTPDGRRGYYTLHDENDDMLPVGEQFFTSDGHPQVSGDGRRIITDTYPDRRRNQHLLLYDLETQTGDELARLRIPFRFRNELRCDFHPRWDRTGGIISFDSAHTGVRSHCTIAVRESPVPKQFAPSGIPAEYSSATI